MPLCSECLERVCKEMDGQIDELQGDIQAYEAALEQLEEEEEEEEEEEKCGTGLWE